jgi:hypothetical protein
MTQARRDPSLRLKSGYAQDDSICADDFRAVMTTFVPIPNQLFHTQGCQSLFEPTCVDA